MWWMKKKNHEENRDILCETRRVRRLISDHYSELSWRTMSDMRRREKGKIMEN